jgi:hypothetical protein
VTAFSVRIIHRVPIVRITGRLAAVTDVLEVWRR